MNELDAALAEVTTGLVELSKQVGPDAAEAVLRAVRIGAVINLVGAFVFVCLSALTLWVGYRLFKKGGEISKADRFGSEDVHFFMGGMLTSITGAMGCVGSLIVLMSPNNWISALDPTAGLAWRLLEKL